MTPELAARNWIYLGVINILAAVSTFSQTQGGPSVAGAIALESRPHIAAYYSVFIVSTLTALTALFGYAYASNIRSAYWAARIPLVIDLKYGPPDYGRRSMQLYQLFFVAVFLIAPLYSAGHFYRVVLNRGVLWNEALKEPVAIVVKHSEPGIATGREAAKAKKVLGMDSGRLWLANSQEDIRFGLDEKLRDLNKSHLSNECAAKRRACRGVEWHHPWSGVFMRVAFVLALAATFAFAGAVFLPTPRG